MADSTDREKLLEEAERHEPETDAAMRFRSGPRTCFRCQQEWPCRDRRWATALREDGEKIRGLEGELAETKEGWRQGILQKKVNMLPETEAAVHIAELEQQLAEAQSDVTRAINEREQEVAGSHGKPPAPHQIQAAHEMAAAIDDLVNARVIDARSWAADARLDFGDPLAREEIERWRRRRYDR